MQSTLTLVWNNNKARWGILFLGGIFLTALLGPLMVDDPYAYIAQPHLPPSYAYLLGTTGQGQDVLAQTVVGARTTLVIGFTVGFLVTLIGTLIGVSAGFIGGRFDDVMSLLINVFLIIPGLPLAIILAAYLPSGPLALTGVLTFTGWAWTARVLRAQTLSLRDRDFILAARITGESTFKIIFNEIVPNLASLLLSTFVGTTIYAIGAQVGLEFLGLGDVGLVTWGTNLYWASNDQALLTQAWWTFVPTGLGVAFVGFALAMINFGIDEITNPRLGVERSWKDTLKKQGVVIGENTPILHAAERKYTKGNIERNKERNKTEENTTYSKKNQEEI